LQLLIELESMHDMAVVVAIELSFVIPHDADPLTGLNGEWRHDGQHSTQQEIVFVRGGKQQKSSTAETQPTQQSGAEVEPKLQPPYRLVTDTTQAGDRQQQRRSKRQRQ